MAGRARCRPPGRARRRWRKQIDDQLAQAEAAVRGGHIAVARAHDRRPPAGSGSTPSAAGGVAPVRTRSLLFLSPWIIGFLRLHRVPDDREPLLLVHPLRPAGRPALGRARQLPVHVHEDPLFWQAMRNTLWIIVVVVPLQIVFAIATATLLTRPRKGVKVYRTLLSSCPTWRPPWPPPSRSSSCSTRPTGRSTRFLAAVGHGKHPPLWFFSPTWSKPGLVLLALWGVGDAMIIFLAGLLDVPSQLYEAADIEGAGAWQRFRLHHPADDLAGDLLLAGDRRDRGVPVLHPGLRGEHHPRAEPRGRALGAPQDSLLFYSIYLYQQGFRVLPHGLRLGDGLDAVRHHDGLHVALIRTSRPVGPLPGRDVR